MINSYKINTRKKRFAFEIIILVITIFISGIIFFIGEYNKNSNSKSINLISTKIDSLNDNYFKNRYENLEKYKKINEYTYESYKKNILNDKDSSFRREIYNRLCNLFQWYESERNLEEFINQYNSTNIFEIEERILNLEEERKIITKNNSDSNKIFLIILIIILVTTYPLRLLYYLIKWSMNTLGEKEITNQQNNDQINKDNTNIKIEKNTNTENIDQPKFNKKSNIPIWLSFNNEYIKGTTYLLRMIFGGMTILIFGFGLYLMVITTYKRTKSLGFHKRKSIILCVIIPIFILLSSVIKITELSTTSYIENINRYYLYLGIIYLLLIPHFLLVFKNGNKNLFETISNKDNTEKIIEDSINDNDEPLSESRKLRKLMYEINKEFPKND